MTSLELNVAKPRQFAIDLDAVVIIGGRIALGVGLLLLWEFSPVLFGLSHIHEY